MSDWNSDPNPEITRVYDAKRKYDQATKRRDYAREQFDNAIVDWEDAASRYMFELHAFVSMHVVKNKE